MSELDRPIPAPVRARLIVLRQTAMNTDVLPTSVAKEVCDSVNKINDITQSFAVELAETVNHGDMGRAIFAIDTLGTVRTAAVTAVLLPAQRESK